jgi:hypothetical protein
MVGQRKRREMAAFADGTKRGKLFPSVCEAYEMFIARPRLTGIDGLYPFTGGYGAGLSLMWFSHKIYPPSSTYCVVNCPEEAKDYLVQYASGEFLPLLLRPFQVDAVISKACAREKKKILSESRETLIKYVSRLTLGTETYWITFVRRKRDLVYRHPLWRLLLVLRNCIFCRRLGTLSMKIYLTLKSVFNFSRGRDKSTMRLIRNSS